MSVILVIDDTQKILDIVKYFLENEGHTVLTSADPLKGIEIAKKEEKVNLLLLDIMMPGMDGYTVFDNLKGDLKTRDIPVIMMTAKAIIMHTPKDFFYGLYGFLSKPFSRRQLLRMVNDILQLTKDKDKGGTGMVTAVDEEISEEDNPE